MSLDGCCVLVHQYLCFEGAKEVWRGCVNLSCEPEKVKRSVLKVIYS